MQKKLPKWYELVDNTKSEGEIESKIFIALCRNPKWLWRSVGALSKETGVENIIVEEVLYKYYKAGIVFQHNRNTDQWAYWENVKNELPEEQPTLTEIDKIVRIHGRFSKEAKKLIP